MNANAHYRQKYGAYDPFLLLLQAYDLPLPQTEVVFAPPRKWRADYLWETPRKVIVEREGGIFRGGKGGGSAVGGHSAGPGILRDMEKGNAAQLAGYLYLRFTPQALEQGDAIEMLTPILRPGRS